MAYHDDTPGNYGGQYRRDDVDIEPTTDAGGGYSVGWTETGRVAELHGATITETARYDIQVRVASAVGRTISDTLPIIGVITWTVPLTKTLHVEFDGQDVTGPLTFLTTGGWQSWTLRVRARRAVDGGRAPDAPGHGQRLVQRELGLDHAGRCRRIRSMR